MIYFCMIVSLPNAILCDVGTVILSRSTNSFGLIVYYWVSSIEFPFQTHAKNQRTSYNLELESPLFHMTAVNGF